MPDTAEFSTKITDGNIFGDDVVLSGVKAKLSSSVKKVTEQVENTAGSMAQKAISRLPTLRGGLQKYAATGKRMKQLMDKGKKMFEIDPVPVGIKCKVILPAEALENIPKVKIGPLQEAITSPFKEAIMETYASYKSDVCREIEKIHKWIEKNQRLNLVIPPDELQDQLSETEKDVERILKGLERDIKKTVANTLILVKRGNAQFADATAEAVLKPKPTGVQLKTKGTLESLPQMSGMQMIRFTERDLWMENKGNEKDKDKDLEHLAPPQFKCKVSYGIEKGVALFFKQNPEYPKKLDAYLSDALDGAVFQTVRLMRNRYKRLDKAAGEGGNEYRMELRVWQRASSSMIRKLVGSIEGAMEAAYDTFVSRELSGLFGNAFKGTKFPVRCTVVAGTARLKAGKKLKKGALTPQGLSDLIDRFCTASFNGATGIVDATKKSDDKNNELYKLIEGLIEKEKNPNKKDEKQDKSQPQPDPERKKQVAQWKKLNGEFLRLVTSAESKSDELKREADKLMKKIKQLSEDITDKKRASMMQKVDKQWQGLIEKCEKLKESIDEDQSYHAKSVKSCNAYESGSDFWTYTSSGSKTGTSSDRTKKEQIYRGHLLSVEIQEMAEDAIRQLKKMIVV